VSIGRFSGSTSFLQCAYHFSPNDCIFLLTKLFASVQGRILKWVHISVVHLMNMKEVAKIPFIRYSSRLILLIGCTRSHVVQ
jgi:hypothetical protein